MRLVLKLYKDECNEEEWGEFIKRLESIGYRITQSMIDEMVGLFNIAKINEKSQISNETVKRS